MDQAFSSESIQLNRNGFLSSAPSLMRLLEIESNLNEIENNVNMQLLAKRAAQEFQVLAQQNDDLFKEKEQFRQKYDDLEQQMDALREEVKELEVYREENQNLMALNAKYQTESQIFEQQTLILQESINDLKIELAQRKSSENASNAKFDIDDDVAASSNAKTESVKRTNVNEQRLMAQVSQIMKEKNALELELDEMKSSQSAESAKMNALSQKLAESQKEVDRLNNDLTEQQDNYIKLR